MAGNGKAFAALKADGSVLTWGIAGWGGSSRAVAAQLSSGVQTVVGHQDADEDGLFKVLHPK